MWNFNPARSTQDSRNPNQSDEPSFSALQTLPLDNQLPLDVCREYPVNRGPYLRKAVIYPIVPLDSAHFRKFVEFMRSLNFNNLYHQAPQTKQNIMAKKMWACINCWEVILGDETKQEHVNARHLLTNSIADTEPVSQENFIKLARVYGKINPEESHVVIFYIPQYVKDCLQNGSLELPHVVEERKKQTQQTLKILDSIIERQAQSQMEREQRQKEYQAIEYQASEYFRRQGNSEAQIGSLLQGRF